MKNSLSTSGLSLSQASSISNILYQRCVEIAREISNYNTHQKSIKVNEETHILQESMPMNKVVELIQLKSRYHATQAFLMENIKAKDNLLKEIKAKQPVFPNKPNSPEFHNLILQDNVTNEWSWNQLSKEEIEEYIEVEALAAHIGQFIHKDGKLSQLRHEISNLPAIEWMVIKDGEKSPVKITRNTTTDELINIYEELSALHRKHEMRVNYFKAKIKNLITEENARIAKENSLEIQRVSAINETLKLEHHNSYIKWQEECAKINQDLQQVIQEKISKIVKLRIAIPERFKNIVDEIMPKE